MAATYRPSIDDYLMIVRRRAGLFIGVFAVVALGGLAVAVLVPPMYRSTGIILVEAQQIPREFVQTTIPTAVDERIQILQRRMMTRDNMLRVIAKYGLFEEAGASGVTSETLDRMLESIRIVPISAKSGREVVTVAFSLSFEHQNPEVAYRVANELVTLFLNENVRTRTQRASETTEFLAQEATKLKAKLATLEGRVAAYKQEHSDALPEHLAVRMAMLQRVESELKSVEREQSATEQELRFLDIELAAAQAGIGTSAEPAASTDPAVQLAAHEREYRRLLQDYTEGHPDVRRVHRAIASLEAEIEEEGGPADAAGERSTNVLVAQVQARIDAADNKVASFQGQATELRARMRDIEDQIFRTPQVERGLAGLVRDHENARQKYEEVRAKQVDAQMAESLEEGNKAERFSLLEPPLPPEEPNRPDRKKILLMGFVLAVGTPGGLVVLLELMDQRVRGAGLLAHIARQQPLASIPYIVTPRERRRRGLRRVLSLLALVGVAAAAAALIHYFYRPLGLILMQIVALVG